MTASDYDTSRWLAHHVIVDDIDYGFAIATISHKDAGWKVSVDKFEGETHSTAFHSGSIKITSYKDTTLKPQIELL